MSNWNQTQQKIYSLNKLTVQVEKWQAEGETVVFTNGVFDLLHLGHVNYLARTSDLGSKLIVAINADLSVKQLNKGPARPIKDQETRAHIMASLSFVDAVLIFDQNTPFDIVSALKPNVLVKGGDYNPDETNPNSKSYIVGSDLVRNSGGQVAVIDFVTGHSTTKLEQKIIALNQSIK